MAVSVYSPTRRTNVGVVNSNQVFANFFDDDGFLFEDTTQILILNTDGSVSQDIVIEYGQLGEVGFRIGVIFDSQNQPSAPIEPLNLFTPSNTVDSEAFEDDIFQQNTVIRSLRQSERLHRHHYSQRSRYQPIQRTTGDRRQLVERNDTTDFIHLRSSPRRRAGLAYNQSY